MVPYWGRLSLRIARTAIAIAGLAWPQTVATLPLAVYAGLSIVLLSETRWQPGWLPTAALLADVAYFGLWIWVAPASWMPTVCLSCILASTVVLHGLGFAIATVVLTMTMSLLIWHSTATAAAFGAFALAVAVYKRYLNGRIADVQRQNVVIRSHTENARDEERARIAADFHDGPLQNFVGFQMRLEVVQKLLERGKAEGAADELHQLQHVCRGQVADLCSFARSMRPADEQMAFGESLTRMVEVFQRDTGIVSTCSAEAEPAEAAQDLLQIVREALHNIQKHSGASRVAVSAAPRAKGLQITVEDNGTGFPFAGRYNLEDLERMRAGPISIKRRVRLLNGDLTIESQPNRGAKLEILIPA